MSVTVQRRLGSPFSAIVSFCCVVLEFSAALFGPATACTLHSLTSRPRDRSGSRLLRSVNRSSRRQGTGELPLCPCRTAPWSSPLSLLADGVHYTVLIHFHSLFLKQPTKAPPLKLCLGAHNLACSTAGLLTVGLHVRTSSPAATRLFTPH